MSLIQTRQLTNSPLTLHRLHGHSGFELQRKPATFYRHKIDSENWEKTTIAARPVFGEYYAEMDRSLAADTIRQLG